MNTSLARIMSAKYGTMPSEREDFYQEALVKELELKRKSRRFIYASIKNRMLDLCKTRDRRAKHHIRIEDCPENAACWMEDDTPLIVRDFLERAKRALDPLVASTVNMLLEGGSYPNIAQAYHTSEATVRRRVSRFVNYIRELEGK